MNHIRIRELISTEIDGELDDAARAVVDEHVSHCSACQQYQKALRTMSDDLHALGPYTLSGGFAERVVRTVRHSEEESRLWLPVELAARRLVLSLAVVVLIFVGLATMMKREEPVVVGPYLAGEQTDSSATRALLVKETISKDDILLAVVTR